MKEKRLPWEMAKAFDQSAPVGDFVTLSEAGSVKDLKFSLSINGELRQEGNSSQMIHNLERLISYISKVITLKTGDLIFTGTPVGVGRLHTGDRIEARLGERQVLACEIR
jgi:2-keto-4-pentenoate hydratase/2-oxohepta-3-ene-1,7-dioic acid hydratase in catechol pathway